LPGSGYIIELLDQLRLITRDICIIILSKKRWDFLAKLNHFAGPIPPGQLQSYRNYIIKDLIKRIVAGSCVEGSYRHEKIIRVILTFFILSIDRPPLLPPAISCKIDSALLYIMGARNRNTI
jgi:hypothetical protein